MSLKHSVLFSRNSLHLSVVEKNQFCIEFYFDVDDPR